MGGPDYEEKSCNDDVCCPVDCVWGQWEEWPSCPSGCRADGESQEKTRTRDRAVEESCNGQKCQGEDYEKKKCSREQELLDENEEMRSREQELLDKIEGMKGQQTCPAGTEHYEGPTTKGHIVKKFDTWGPEYHISFKFRLNRLQPKGWNHHHNIFHFTDGGNCCDGGKRVPALFITFEPDEKKTDANVNLNVWITNPYTTSYHSHPFQIDVNTWYSVKIEQRKTSDDQAMFTFNVDGKDVWTRPTNPIQFKNVQWYQSSPWFESFDDSIEIQDMAVVNNPVFISG